MLQYLVTMHLLGLFFFPASLLFNSLLASPTSLNNFDFGLANISTLALPISNNSLGYIPPTGPEWFSCSIERLSPSTIDPKDVFVTAIKMLEIITQGDFNSRMPQARMSFRGSNNLVIAVNSLDPAQPIVRRFVMWAISRILLTMNEVPHVGYHAGFFIPRWRGEAAGKIYIGYSRNPSDLFTEATTSSKLLNTTAMVGNDEIAWIFSPSTGGPLMTMWDVAMGTNGALIMAGKEVLPLQRIQMFSGNFLPEASAICHSRAAIMPSRLSQSILVRTLAAGSLWALEDGDFHELDVKALLDGELIAQGGINKMPSGLSTLGNGTAVSSS